MTFTLTKTDNVLGLSAQDFLVLKTLDHDFFPNPWSDSSWEDLRTLSENVFFVLLKQEEELVGFILFSTIVADSFAHLLKIVVHPVKREKGLGKKSLGFAIDELKALGIKTFFLEVEEGNSAAIALYEGLGFKTIHHKKHFYHNGATALIMTLGV